MEARTPEQQALIEQHIPLVTWVAKKMWRASSVRKLGEFSDVLQIGYMALIWAADHWRPERGVKFATYASNCIRRKIADASKSAGVIKVTKYAALGLEAEAKGKDVRQSPEILDKGRNALRIGQLSPHMLVYEHPEYDDTVEVALERLAKIDERSATLIRKRFGIGCDPVSRKDMAAQEGVTVDAFDQRQMLAMRRLREVFETLDTGE